MSELIHQVVYISRNELVGDTQCLHREIDTILQASRANNQAVAITGALLFNAVGFAQVLEGPHAAVQATFERIQCDTRHSQIAILSFESAHQRHFPNWSMGYTGCHTHAAQEFGDIARCSRFDPALLDGDRIFSLLIEHMKQAEPA